MMYIYSCDATKDEFLALYKEDFGITAGSKMETFLAMVVEQKDMSVQVHLDNYVKKSHDRVSRLYQEIVVT